MMRNWKKIIISILSGLILFFIIILRSAIWNDYLLKKINKNISKTGWSIDVNKSSGYLFGTTYIDGVIVDHPLYDSVSIKRATININFFSTIFDRTTFDLINLEGVNANIPNSLFGNSKNDMNNGFNIPFNINSIFISGEFNLIEDQFSSMINLKLGGELTGGNKSQLKCDLLKISFNKQRDYEISLRKIYISKDELGISLDHIQGDVFGLPIEGMINYNQNINDLSGELKLTGFQFPEELFSKLPIKSKFSSFTGQFNFSSDFKSYLGSIILENELGLNMRGDFLVQNKDNIWKVDTLKLYGENSSLVMNGFWIEENRLNCNMTLENLDLSRWLENQKKTEMSGIAILDGHISTDGSLDKVDLTMEIMEKQYFDEGQILFRGKTSFQDSILKTIEPMTIIIDESLLRVDGEINFFTDILDISADLENAQIDLINQFLPGNYISGKATGSMRIYDNIYSPSAKSELMCTDIKIDDFDLKTLSLSSQMKVSKDGPIGFLDLKAEDGVWQGRFFQNAVINSTFENNKIILENCNFVSGKDFLYISGKSLGDDRYKVNKIEIAYDDNYLVNSGSLEFVYKDTVLEADPFEFHINDGILEGVITGLYDPEIRLKMSNFDAGIITQFFNDQRLQITGLVFGELWTKLEDNKIDLDIDLSLKDGIYMKEEFDDFQISFLFKDKMLHLDDFSMTRAGKMGFQANGVIPIDRSNIINVPIDIQSSFSNLSLEFIHRFIPKFYKIKGFARGSIKLGGLPNNTQFVYDLDIDDGEFDRVNLGKVISKGHYDGYRLHISNTKSVSKLNTVIANGTIPFDLNINSDDFGKLYHNDSIDFYINGELKTLPFLSAYISELDSVKGDFDIQLSLTGPTNSIQRNGYIKVKNSDIFTLLINDPIFDASGEAYMSNNQLLIKKFDAKLFHPNANFPEPLNNNTSIEGSIDFSKFFNPKYNLMIKASEASFQTLKMDILGLANLDLSIVGKDTVAINGIIEALDATVFYEFTTEDVGTALTEELGTIMSYQLNIPIKESILFQNSQVDAKLVGEFSLYQMGYQEMDFGGEIFVEDGNVFSYKDNFKNLQGYVSFDNKGFNPFLDVSAFTTIDDERIDLRITGQIEDLDIILESASGFSESDILELITWGKRFQDQELTSKGFGNQTVSFLGSLLETQLEKNIKDSELGKMGLVDDINISGTAGFIQDSNEDFELIAKRQIGDKTFLNLSYKRSFSLTNPNQSQIGVEYKLNRHFSVVGNIDEDGKLNLKYRYRYAY